MAPSIRDVMTVDPVTLPGSATVRQAAQEMDRAEIGNVIVLNDANEAVGSSPTETSPYGRSLLVSTQAPRS